MRPDAQLLCRLVSAECGLPFDVQRTPLSAENIVELYPSGHEVKETFVIRTAVGWRSLDVSFLAGKFASDLLVAMGKADTSARLVCTSILEHCIAEGASVVFRINGENADTKTPTLWPWHWTKLELQLKKGQLDVNSDDAKAEIEILRKWIGRMAAAVLALLPVEEISGLAEEPEGGFPEGARTMVEVNKYERDRRNRAAAIAIHGVECRACNVDMGARYGEAASGFIEVHHLTPVSRLGPDYLINPATDLVPLCPNCHAVAHRKEPAYSPAEIVAMLQHRKPGST